jgi:uncharacterized delta-60 repeat protein
MKLSLRHGLLLTLCLLPLLLTACGGGGGSDASPQPNPQPNPLPAGTIGAGGGTVIGASGGQVVVPAGALSQNVTILITQSSTGAPALPAGVTVAGQMFAFQPHGTSFASPATVTIPFDPALVPAGSSVSLYKTTAGEAGWEIVSGATVSGSSISAAVTGFSYMVAGAPVVQTVETPWRWWEFSEILANKRYQRLEGNTENLRTTVQEPPGEMFKPIEFGPLTLNPVGSDTIASGEIFGTANGRTYWAEVEAPIAEDRYAAPDTTATGGKAVFIQKQSYRKDDANATLSLTITQAFIEALDFNGTDPLFARCPLDEASVRCQDILDAKVSFHVLVVSGRQGDGEITRFVHHWKNGFMTLAGFQDNWFENVSFWPQSFNAAWDEYHEFVNPEALPKGHPLWNRDQFSLTVGTNASSAIFTLTEPLVVPVDISEVDEDEEFTLDVRIYIEANNRRARESYLKARLRDPVNAGGVATNITGLTATNRPVLGPITIGAPPALEPCSAGNDPESGTLQFSSAAYLLQEPDTAERIIEITRTGGTRGALRALVSTSNGTGVSGTHYQQVAQLVEFDSGDDVARVIGVPVIDNNTEDGDVTVNLTLTAEENCATLGSPATAVLTIIDDEYVPPEPGPSGQLDTTFNTDGLVNTGSFGGAQSKMIMQADGKFVIVGGTFTDFIAARFNADGSEDSGFGGTGRVTTDVAGGLFVEYARAVVQQPDGKLVVAGEGTLPNNSAAVAMVRYNADGTLDNTFSGDGKVLEAAVAGRAYAVALQSDGKIVVAGSAPVTGGSDYGDMMVARFNVDGSLDSGFGTAGVTTFDLGIGTDVARNLVVLTDGSVVVAGEAQPSSGNTQTAVAKLDGNGDLDVSFGVAGKLAIPGANAGRGFALQSDGKLLLAGGTQSFPSSFVVMRLNADGSYDSGFGNGGASVIRTSTSTTGEGDIAATVAVRPDGYIYVAGKSGSINENFGLVRFTAAGELDTSFGTNGISNIDFNGLEDGAESVVIQQDGKVVMGGYARPTSNDGYGLARVHP